ncbi:MAG: insulinase family protein [Lachnospiraceae bacterium]|nr:insulinase family protein [Lachnospiraceae bacterium]
MKIPKSYEIIDEQYLDDIKAQGYLISHKKTKAKVAIIPDEKEDNKVFFIGFRTPPHDSTGVPHIMEHSVLCGSDKYPVKDPFVELAKGSLNTFLNAMTYPDKTVYPVASCNDKDFQNLMDVYLDAVFHPSIFSHKEIFEQEGWHYELDSEDGELKINGVVYNEMKGAYSSPNSVLTREIFSSLFPDTEYFHESGGDPKAIPELTYEDFVGFYKRYYHPSNSYIYLYGDCDMYEKLDYIDKEYLCNFDKLDIESSIHSQKPFDKVIRVEKEYPIATADSDEDGTYLTYNYCVDIGRDPKKMAAFEMLDYALLNSPGAPIRKELYKAGIGKAVLGGFDDGVKQPVFTIAVKDANLEDEEKFLEIIESVLKKQVAEGLDQKALLACINSIEFRVREADFGSYPKGLMYGLDILDSWLYDSNNPFIRMNDLKMLKELKKDIGTSYFRDLIKEYFLDNKFASIVISKPKKGLTAKEDEELREKLAEKKASMSAEEIKAIIDNTKHLHEYQQTPSSNEELEKLPMLNREDLDKDIRKCDVEEKDIGGIKVIHSKVDTSNIHYLKLLFSIDHISLEELPYVSLLSKLLGLVDTENYSYSDLSNEIDIQTGGIGTSISAFSRSSDDYNLYFRVNAKFISDRIMYATELLEEMMLRSDFSDVERLKTLVKIERSKLETSMNSSAHIVAGIRANASIAKSALMEDKLSGIEYYRFIRDLEENFDSRCHDFQRKCIEMTHSIFRRSNLLVSSTGDDKIYNQLNTYLPDLARHLFTDNYRKSSAKMICIKKNEAFKDASKIQYVARGGDYKALGYEYSGYLHILKSILNYDYLWINVRVQGGAYGCMVRFRRNGLFNVVSYRDPNLKKTNETFEGIADYVRNFDVTDRDMTKYIIGTIAELDRPLSPDQKGAKGLALYMNGLTDEQRQKERDEILNATPLDIRKEADLIEAVLGQNCLCVIGNEENIEANAEMFDSIMQLT